MSVSKVPLTLQRLSGKEEQQRQAPQNLASHAVRITRGELAQMRGFHHRQCGHRLLCHRQFRQQARIIKNAFGELEQVSVQPRTRLTTRELLAPMNQR